MNFHNRSTVDEVIARGSTPRFLRHSVYVLWCNGCDIRLAIKRLWMEHPAILLHVTKLVHSFHCIALRFISCLVLYCFVVQCIIVCLAFLATYNVHLRLIGKRVMDIILVLIELFFAKALRAK